jgi:hypothetical protein
VKERGKKKERGAFAPLKRPDKRKRGAIPFESFPLPFIDTQGTGVRGIGYNAL